MIDATHQVVSFIWLMVASYVTIVTMKYIERKKRMKRIAAFLLAVTMLTGCWGLNVDPGNDLATRILVKIATREIACEIKASGNIELNRTLINVYESAKLGQLTPDALVQLSDLVTDRPTLALAVADLVALLGVQIDDSNGLVTGIEDISPEMFRAIEEGYEQGYQICRVRT